ncbi:DUF3558 family protein [Antrihabitans stalactiti]|uniref:DUF3558 domain-containing protein n=1 Tax=Antrihabitans stalactiti TaxID=2584121 RepID=A0A848KR83_9NOCA|nr:DUF3558 domain-containing protein [Antrihabitans stalactiti]
MRTKLPAVAAIAVALVLSGCGGGDKTSDDDAIPTRTPPKVSPAGPFFGECGSVTDQEVQTAFGVSSFASVTRNSVGCVWEVGGGSSAPSVSFSWYRGSPIGREAAGSDRLQRPPKPVEIRGHEGFIGQIPGQLCELGLQYGDDFMHWSVTYAGFPPFKDECAVARELAELTASRVQG